MYILKHNCSFSEKITFPAAYFRTQWQVFSVSAEDRFCHLSGIFCISAVSSLNIVWISIWTCNQFFYGIINEKESPRIQEKWSKVCVKFSLENQEHCIPMLMSTLDMSHCHCQNKCVGSKFEYKYLKYIREHHCCLYCLPNLNFTKNLNLNKISELSRKFLSLN